MRTSHLLIHSMYLQLQKYNDLSLTYMRIWCFLNEMCLLILGMMNLSWMKGTSIKAWSCKIAASMWGSKRTLRVKISELWSLHNGEWRLGRNIQDYISQFCPKCDMVLRHLNFWSDPCQICRNQFSCFLEFILKDKRPSETLSFSSSNTPLAITFRLGFW
jgi:hypothetical protein